MKTRQGEPGRLPGGGTAFVGRRDELAWLRRLDDAGERLVTIVGPAGAGKTRLAVQFAADARPASRFADLTGAAGPAEALRVVGGALGMAGPGAGDPIERIGDVLAALGPCRLLLDNAEGVAPILPGAIEAWLERAPDARILVTSRQRLGIPAELPVELGGLEPADGAALFVARLERLDPRRKLDVAEPLLLRLVQRLDAMPLAIELAAARGRDLPLADLLAALGHRLDLLVDPRAPAARGRSLRAALDECWGRLEPAAAGALAALSVLEGPFDREAAAAVLGEEADALALLAQLVDRSLVAVDREGSGLYLLYEGIREYASERLGDCTETTRQLHAAFFARRAAAAAARASGSDPLGALAEVERDGKNLLAAFRSAAPPQVLLDLMRGLDLLLAERGPFDLHESLCADALGRLEDDGFRAEVLRLRGRARLLRGWPRKALADLEAAHALAAAAGDAALLGRCVDGLVPALRQTGALDRARLLCDERLAAARAAGSTADASAALFQLGGIQAAAGQIEEALRSWLDGLALAREAGAARIEALQLTNLALVHFKLGRREAGEHWSDRALAALEACGAWLTASRVLANRAAHLLRAGDLEAGERWLVALEERMAHVRDGEIDAVARFCRGRLSLAQGRTEVARSLFEEALALCRSSGAAHLAAGFAADLEAVEARSAPGLAIDPRERLLVVGERRIELARRAALWRIVAALCDRHGGEALSVQELVEIGWPGEQMRPESGSERVYTAIRMLRRMGLEPLLLTREGGYLLDPAAAISTL